MTTPTSTPTTPTLPIPSLARRMAEALLEYDAARTALRAAHQAVDAHETAVTFDASVAASNRMSAANTAVRETCGHEIWTRLLREP